SPPSSKTTPTRESASAFAARATRTPLPAGQDNIVGVPVAHLAATHRATVSGWVKGTYSGRGMMPPASRPAPNVIEVSSAEGQEPPVHFQSVGLNQRSTGRPNLAALKQCL